MANHFGRAIALGFAIAAGAGYGEEKGSAKAGETVYKNNCLVCHGPAGDGKGLVGKGLNPMPRDFTKDEFKFKTTPKGSPPSDEDVINTIKNGSKGTAMPPWSGVLNPAQMKDVLAYIKTFNPGYWQVKATAKAKGGK